MATGNLYPPSPSNQACETSLSRPASSQLIKSIGCTLRQLKEAYPFSHSSGAFHILSIVFSHPAFSFFSLAPLLAFPLLLRCPTLKLDLACACAHREQVLRLVVLGCWVTPSLLKYVCLTTTCMTQGVSTAKQNKRLNLSGSIQSQLRVSSL